MCVLRVKASSPVKASSRVELRNALKHWTTSQVPFLLFLMFWDGISCCIPYCTWAPISPSTSLSAKMTIALKYILHVIIHQVDFIRHVETEEWVSPRSIKVLGRDGLILGVDKYRIPAGFSVEGRCWGKGSSAFSPKLDLCFLGPSYVSDTWGGGSKLQFYPEFSAFKEESQVYMFLGQQFWLYPGCEGKGLCKSNS